MMEVSTYKNSGVDWLGDIPEHWEVKRLKQNTYLKGRIGWQNLRANEFVEEGPYCITGTDFIKGKINWNTCYKVTESRYEIDEKIHLRDGDLLITKDGTIGKVALVMNMPYKATLNSGIMLVRPTTRKFHTQFLFWVLISEVFYQFNEYTKSGSTILHLYQNVFERMPFPVPTIDEQTTIANYLDEKTTKIDRLIQNKTDQIERLKEIRQIEITRAVTKGLDSNVSLKPSGIDWLGDIPEHWEVKRLKNIIKLNPSKGSSIYSQDDNIDVTFLPMEKVLENGTYLEDLQRPISTVWNGFTYFERGDIILAKITPCYENGKGALLKEMKTKVGFGSTEFHVLRTNNIIAANNFLYYVTKSDMFMQVGEAMMTGSAGQKRVPSAYIEYFKIGLPSLTEQTTIANYLDEKTTKIDQLVDNLQDQIKKLEEIRKIEIYNAVTGKTPL